MKIIRSGSTLIPLNDTDYGWCPSDESCYIVPGTRNSPNKCGIMNPSVKIVFFRGQVPAAVQPWHGHAFSHLFRLSETSSNRERRSFYDTFDWHAYEKKIAVFKKKHTLHTISLDSGLETAYVELPGSPASFFVRDIPAGQVREQLSACSGIRAFSKIASFDVVQKTSRIVDDNAKTIGFFLEEEYSPAGKNIEKPFLSLFSIQPLKGYQDEAEEFSEILASHGSFGDPFDFRELFRLLMNAAGRKIQGYSSKISLHLNPETSAHESARKVLHSALSTMKANEEGLKNNIDPEFLHDYRVAVRRTRSLLKQLNGVFSPEDTGYFLAGFSEIGKRSNNLRDCDVYLLRRDEFFNSLPDFLQQPLDRFFTDLEASRKRYHRQLCRYLESDECRTFFSDWGRFLANPALPGQDTAPGASLPTIEIANAGIRKAWKKVVRRGRIACREATDDELHELRICCKKLRYLLEFFASVYPVETVTPVIRQLKELQENLGTFVDYAVQIRFLRERLVTIVHGPESHLFAASTGGLITTLNRQKEETRALFHKAFRAFDDHETRRRFSELLENEALK